MHRTSLGGNMRDPAIEALLQGPSNKISHTEKKTNLSRYEAESNRQLKNAVEEIIAEEAPSHSQLLSPQAYRLKLENELKSGIQFTELSEQLSSAFSVISKGKKYVESTPYAIMIGEFAKATTHLDSVEIDKIYEHTLQTLLKISDTTMDSLTSIAIAKYEEGIFLESLAVYSLLSTLAPENSNYWYRVGITAHKCEKYELALKAYSVACIFDPLLIGARVFASECYLTLGEFKDAETEFIEAKKILDAWPADKNKAEEAQLIDNLKILIEEYSAA